MKHPVRQIVEKGAKSAVNVRRLAAGMAMGSDQPGAAVQANRFVRVAIRRLALSGFTLSGFGSARQQRGLDKVTKNFAATAHQPCSLRATLFMVLSAAPGQGTNDTVLWDMTMKRLIVPALALLAMPSALLAARGDMSLAVFIPKAEALQAQGPLALFSPELEVLKAEGKAAGEAYRARLIKERSQGRPSSCPPENAQIVPEELLGFLKKYPVSGRPRISIRQGVADYFIRKYPCTRR